MKVFTFFLLWVILGCFFFSSIPFIYVYETSILTQAEPFFASPVALNGKRGVLRQDKFGKGYFGASRNGGRTHKGIDIQAPLGTPILASKSGRVSVAGVDAGYGNYVEIFHPDGLVTRYAHLASMNVRAGDWVKKEQPVGACGKTGNADDSGITPHVHYEIRYKKYALNPTEGLLDPSIRFTRQKLVS